ncbi:MAG: hypothetical protein OHK0032_08870 [Thermodesulfovibrionales bacterium]
MQKLTYPNEEIKGNVSFVGEERERYISTLDSATELFNKKLKDIERRCLNAGEDPDELLNATAKALTDMTDVFEEFERGVNYDKQIIRDARVRFREKTNPILSKSYCINRARTWPQGYQGDYKTLEIVYRNTPMSEGIGYYLDKCMLSTPLAIGVRERIAKLRDLLEEELADRKDPRVLDIACGSCREVFELAPAIEESGARFTCIDLDSDALNFALNRLAYTDIPSDHIQFLKYNALRMFDHELNMEEFGMQDVIYSVGYFDYLRDDFLVKLLNALYMLLNPGGKLIAAFKDVNYYRPQPYHWIADWDGFLQRTKEDFDSLFKQAGIPDSALSTTRVRSEMIIFYTVTKQ